MDFCVAKMWLVQQICGTTFPGEPLPAQTSKKESTEKQTHLTIVFMSDSTAHCEKLMEEMSVQVL